MSKSNVSQNASDPEFPEDDSPYSMTEEILRKRLNHPSHGNIGRQLFAGVLACLTSLSFGNCIGWAHSISKQIRSKKAVYEINWLISIMFIGCCLGVTSSSLLIKQMGPKKTLVVIGPFYILNWWLTLIQHVESQMAGRFFLGFMGVTYSNAGETLLSQTIHYDIRQRVSVFYSSTFILGIFLSRVIGTATNPFWSTIFCAFIPMIHYSLIHIVPESPVFLYATSHVAAAKSLTWYRGKGNFYMDMAMIKKDWDLFRQDPGAYRYMLFAPAVYRSFTVILILTALQITSGYFVFLLYSFQVLIRYPPVISLMADSTIIGICFFISKTLWWSLHIKFNWKVRTILLCSMFFTGVFLSLFTAYLLAELYFPEYIHHFRWISLPLVCCYIFLVDMGLNYYPKLLISEYMPIQIFRLASLITQAAYWLFIFCNIFIVSTILTDVENYKIFATFAATIFVGTLYAYFFVVEPRGKSLIQIQMEFKANPVGRRGARAQQYSDNSTAA